MTIHRLNAIIEEHGRWSALLIYTDRIEAHMESDFSHSVENVKALLETICKEICVSRDVDMGPRVTINALMKRAFIEIGYPASDIVTQISTSLSTIGQKIGELRNEISPTSHGKTLNDLNVRNDKVELLAREFLIDATVSIASLLIRSFENSTPRIRPKDILIHTECSDFNDFIDESYDPLIVGENSYPASEAFFGVDYTSYETEYRKFASEPDV